MKRTFTGGAGAERRLVVIEISGARLGVLQKKADGTTKRNVKELPSEADARSECDRIARDLLSRGYVEQSGAVAKQARPAAVVPASEALSVHDAYDDVEPAAPVLPRRGAPVAATPAEAEPKKKKKSGKKKKRKAKTDDGLDKRVLLGIAAVGLALVGLVGYIVYDGFIKPPTIVGTWKGSMIDFEIGKPIIHTQYELLLDEKKRASMTLQEKFTSVGTYAVKGDRLVLTFQDDEGGETSEREYKFKLGRTTMDLYDPRTGKQLVELIRFTEAPVIRGVGKDKEKDKAPSKDLIADAEGEVDKAADERLASVAYAAKDNAFRLRHPLGWEAETGARGDNSYSWVSLTKGSAKVQITADVQGSLMSGSDTARGDIEEGSELAPVHVAHEQHAKAVAEDFSDYKESKPTLFKGAGLGEGRIATFTASGSGLFGSKLRGYRLTLLTNDRRVTVLCHAPADEFDKLKPTFLAVCRSLSR